TNTLKPASVLFSSFSSSVIFDAADGVTLIMSANLLWPSIIHCDRGPPDALRARHPHRPGTPRPAHYWTPLAAGRPRLGCRAHRRGRSVHRQPARVAGCADKNAP